MTGQNYFKIALCFILFTAISIPVQSQNFLLQKYPQEYVQLGLRFLHPIDIGLTISVLYGTYDLWVNAPVNAKINLIADLPFASFSNTSPSFEESDNDIGNIFLGIEIQPDSAKKSSLIGGIFLPTAGILPTTGEANDVGSFSNFFEWEKYLPGFLTLYGNYAIRSKSPESDGAYIGLDIGPSLLLAVDEYELLVHYGLTAGVRTIPVVIALEFTELSLLLLRMEDISMV